MNKFYQRTSNYDKYPAIKVVGFDDHYFEGWQSIVHHIATQVKSGGQQTMIITIECYTGVHIDEIVEAFSGKFENAQVYLSSDCFKPVSEVDKMVYPDVTDDDIFGYLTRLKIEDYFDQEKLTDVKQEIVRGSGISLIIGTGAVLLADPDLLLYADMPRWEGQLRYRRNEASNLGSDNKQLKASLQYKRAYFVDWRVCDRLKKKLKSACDYVLDTVIPGKPKMITQNALEEGLSLASRQPFRVVPFFDPGPWGGQWMKEVCDLDQASPNFAWCFDCVPEENSLLLAFGEHVFEIPSINLVFSKPQALLGETVFARFGEEFPIRFDFLDTMDGGNLSLQVHPSNAYIRENFGMDYTQDESYYILDATESAEVYLGLKDNTEPSELIAELQEAKTTARFDADKFVNKWPAKKHDHFLIPAGTVHCSGANSMVLEISATPYIFTFKLWDWGRLGLDGLPRPINIEHGEKVINWNCDTGFAKNKLINQFQEIAVGDGWKEEKTGLYQTEFIETRRHWFSKKVEHHTGGNLNVLNLIEGKEALVESPTGAFDPYIVHYAETFIVPAAVGAYTISPYGESGSELCGTLKAFVRP